MLSPRLNISLNTSRPTAILDGDLDSAYEELTVPGYG